MSHYPHGDEVPRYCDGCRWPYEECVCDLLETCRHCAGTGGGVSPDEPWGYDGATPGGWDPCPVCDGEGAILVLPPKHGPVDYRHPHAALHAALHARGCPCTPDEVRQALVDVLEADEAATAPPEAHAPKPEATAQGAQPKCPHCGKAVYVDHVCRPRASGASPAPVCGGFTCHKVHTDPPAGPAILDAADPCPF